MSIFKIFYSKFKETIRRILKIILSKFSNTKLGRFINELIIKEFMRNVCDVNHNGVDLKFTVPSPLTFWRAESFSLNEPETLKWIDEMPQGSVLWDVGANVGIYSAYAAKKKNCTVFAFEPSVFNLELLSRNLFINGLQDRVNIIPLAISDALGCSVMRMTTTEWGGALSSFDKEFGYDGNAIKDIFSFNTFGLTIDQAVSLLNLPEPEFIKLDVDGTEHFILEGATKTLRKIESILLEINDDFVQQAENSMRILKNAGLELKCKKQSELFGDTEFNQTFNQIWERV